MTTPADPFTRVRESADAVRAILRARYLEADDEEKYALTACYAADRCQGDLGCPRRRFWCHRVPGLNSDYDGYDD